MPTRVLREGILDSERVCSLSFPGEVFYRRLMSVVDDFGRFDARTNVLRSRLYPLQIEKVREADIERWIAECVKAGLIVLYSVSGKQYLLYPNLGSPRAKESKFPAPPTESEASAQMNTDEYRRAQMNTDASACIQTRADVPGSGSGSGSNTSSGTSSESNGPAIPDSLDTDEFRSAWDDWTAYRRERKLTTTDRTVKSQLKMLEKLGARAAIETIEVSIRNGWAGLFPEKTNGNRSAARRDSFRSDADPVADKYSPEGIARLRACSPVAIEGQPAVVGPSHGPGSPESPPGAGRTDESEIPL